MPAFFEYLRNIVYYLMFATVVGIFAPSGKYRKFVSLVLGFVLLLLIVQPLTGLFRGEEAPITEWFAEAFGGIGGENATLLNAEEAYAMRWDAHLRETFEAQLEAQLARQLAVGGFILHEAHFDYTDDFGQITRVGVSMSEGRVSTDGFIQPPAPRVPLIRIQPPQIRVRPVQINEPTEEADDDTPFCATAEAVKILISQFYNLPKSHIYVEVINPLR